VLAGTIAAEPVVRQLPSGDEVTECPTAAEFG
jgi:single-stranded DNA-binding protein